jgi:hypothetical protein
MQPDGSEPFRKSWRVLPDWVSAYLRNNTHLTLCLPKGHSALNCSHREWPTQGHQRSGLSSRRGYPSAKLASSVDFPIGATAHSTAGGPESA